MAVMGTNKKHHRLLETFAITYEHLKVGDVFLSEHHKGLRTFLYIEYASRITPGCYDIIVNVHTLTETYVISEFSAKYANCAKIARNQRLSI